jgi:hypothetical protein
MRDSTRGSAIARRWLRGATSAWEGCAPHQGHTTAWSIVKAMLRKINAACSKRPIAPCRSPVEFSMSPRRESVCVDA